MNRKEKGIIAHAQIIQQIADIQWMNGFNYFLNYGITELKNHSDNFILGYGKAQEMISNK